VIRRTPVVAYTAAFGPDAAPPHVQPIAPDVPLVCFTDRPDLAVRGYDVRCLELPQSTAYLRAKYVKVMAHEVFPDVEWAIWFDSSIRFKTGRLTGLVRAAGAAAVAIHPHSVRACVYDEAAVCMTGRLDEESRIAGQMSRYRAAGYPAAAGLWENGVIVRRLAESRVVDLNQAWWREIQNGSVRDQLSLPIVVRESGVDVQPLTGNVYDDRFAAIVRGPMSALPIRRSSRFWSWLASNPLRRSHAPLFHHAHYLATAPELDPRARAHPFDHYLKAGWREDRDPHPLFDVSYYLEANPDVADAGVEPFTHYCHVGGREGRDPHVLFDTAWYLAEYGDASRHAAGGALGHYVRHGWRAGAQPNRWFSPSDYRERYPDVAAAGIEPLEHYLRHGISEGRDPRMLRSPACPCASPSMAGR
jgi:hypothetical protein